MTRYVFKMPDLGEGTVEAEVVAWHITVGDMVQEDQVIAEVMTDKAAVEVPAPVSGKIVTAFDIARTMAIGADWCNAARGFMFSLGCIQAQTCHTGFCPTGVTTQDP